MDLSAENSKRKTRNSSTDSTSSISPPVDKRKKIPEDRETFENIESEDEVLKALDMTQEITVKLDKIFDKLSQIEEKMSGLEEYIKNVDQKTVKLHERTTKLEESVKRSKETVTGLEKGVNFLNHEVEQAKNDLHTSTFQLSTQLQEIQQQQLYLDVYQRRENLRFYGIPEDEDSDDNEDTEQTLIDFLGKELKIKDADEMEFQRIHRIGKKQGAKNKNPRPIIARFLRYPEREKVFGKSYLLKGKKYGISADFPKVIVERRKKLLPRLIDARKEGKRAYFSRPEPDKLFIDGELVPMYS